MSAQERWERVRALFDDARLLPVEQRAAFLNTACPDPALRIEVDTLLRAHAALEMGVEAGFLEGLDALRTAALLAEDETAPEELSAGQTLGRYRVLRRLGHGGMGVVYLAEDPRLNRVVALKLLPRHLSLDEDARRRFEEEARAASALDHPNIVTIYEIGDAPDGRLFIAMAYCEGGTLRDALASAPLPVHTALNIAAQIADGLAAAHRRGIVHRDIKPRNIIVTPDGVVRIVDFGIAKVTGSALTQTALTPGTVAYMSPEQTRGSTVDVRADVWALGAVLYEMLSGKRAFLADSEQALIYAIRNDEPDPLARVRPDVPERMTRVVNRCLSKDVEERYPDAGAVLVELRTLLTDASPNAPPATPATAAATRGMSAVPVRARFSIPRIRTIAAAALVIAAVTLGVRATVGEPRLEPRRVAVGHFENRTGSAQLDEVASMADEWITRGLWQTGFIQVVPLAPAATHDTGAARSPRALAQEDGARLLVSGALYRDNDVLRLHARITDVVDGRLVASIDPITAPIAAPLDGVEELGNRVLAALYPPLDTQITHIRALPRPPRFEAYSAYLAGREAHAARDLPGALRHFQRAAALDSTFVLPHVISAIVLNMMGNVAAADSIIRQLEEVPDDLDRFSRAHVDWLRGTFDGDRHASHAGMKEAARLAPGSTLVNYQLADETVRLGRPRDALELLYSFAPERGELRGWFGYWQVLTTAHHLRKNHFRELTEARRAREIYRDDPRALMVELQALAALGRTKSIEQLVDDALAGPLKGEPNPGALMLNTALELRAHLPALRRSRHERAADRLLERAIEWYQRKPPEQQTVRERYELTMALGAAGRRNEARRLLEILPHIPASRPPGPSPFGPRMSANFPDSVASRGSLGVIAALDADTAAAAAALSWLERFHDPYARGRPTYWRAAILAAQGGRVQAVALLRNAFGEGLPYSRELHVAPELASLRDYGPFQSLLRTRE